VKEIVMRSFEHLLLGDAVSAARRADLLALWRDTPEVPEAAITERFPEVRTLTLGPDDVVVTYGELTALPDYLANPPALDAVGGEVLVPMLQHIRHQAFGDLTGRAVTFPGAADDLDELTACLGADRYHALLARGACHSAPYSRHRWQASHVIARALARQSFAAHRSPALARQAWVYHGYAEHFLHDSFAAGHLVNTMLVSQWLFHDGDHDGPVDDPQTVHEQSDLAERIARSGVLPGPRGLAAAYQEHLEFLADPAVRLAVDRVRDVLGAEPLWASSPARPEPFRTGPSAAAPVAALSRQALRDILDTGGTAITVDLIRDHFPTRAGGTPDAVVDLRTWNDGLRDRCGRIAGQVDAGSVHVGLVSRDQAFAAVRCPDPGFDTIAPAGDTTRYVGDNGWIYERDPGTGRTVHDYLLTPYRADADADHETRLCTDGVRLYAGVHGHVHAMDLSGNWHKPAWSTPIATGPVHVAGAGGRLFAAADGTVFQLHPATGTVLHSTRIGAGETRLAVTGTDVYARAGDHVYRLWVNDSWQGFGGTPALRSVTVAVYPSGRPEIFGIGVDGTLHHTCRPADGWTAHFNRAPAAMRSVAACAGLEGGVEVFGVGVDDSLSHCRLTPGGVWLPWTRNVGKPPARTAAVTVARPAGGQPQAFLLDDSGVVHHNERTARGWQRWTPYVDAPALNSVAAVAGQELAVFGAGTDGTLWRTGRAGTDWTRVEPVPRVVAVTTARPDRVSVFAVDRDGRLYRASVRADADLRAALRFVQVGREQLGEVDTGALGQLGELGAAGEAVGEDHLAGAGPADRR
jgi:hypothetical protein